MDTYGTNLGERFAATALEKYYETAVQPMITNDNYEKLLSAGGASKFSVLTYGDLTINTYVKGTPMTVQDVSESEGECDPDQQKGYYFRINSLAQFESYVNDAKSAIIDRAAKQLKQGVDTYVLGLYADAGSGNRVGTDYVTGDITITITTGACVGNGTTWTSGMSGLGIKATGHSKWYRFTYASGTTGFVYNDSDDDTASYDGGTITSAAYTIEASTVLTVTITNIVEYIDKLAEKLDQNEIPKEDRWLVVNAKIAHLIRRSEEYTPAVESAYQEVVKKGLIGMISGFSVYQNERVAGNNTTGYYILAGHKSAITFVMEYTQSAIEEDIIGDFGKAYKGLIVYGAKILDERRKALAYLWCKT